MSSFPSRDAVVALLAQLSKPLTMGELADHAGVPGSKGLLRFLDNLVLEGVIGATSDDRFISRRVKDLPPAAAAKLSPAAHGAGQSGSKGAASKGMGHEVPKARKPLADVPAPRSAPASPFPPTKPGKRTWDAASHPAAAPILWTEEPSPASARSMRKKDTNARFEPRQAEGPRKGLPRDLSHLARAADQVQDADNLEHGAAAASGGRKPSLVEGQISVNARGFAFVAGGVDGDVFIPPGSLGSAMHGDKVRISITGRSARGREGIVTDVLARGKPRISGILRRRGNEAWVEPDDTRVRGPILLARGIDAAGPGGNSGDDGDLVVVSITRHPDDEQDNPEGKLVAVLGRPGELLAEVQKTILVAGIEELHSDEAVAEAEAYGETVPEEMLRGREDLTHLPLPTIDPEDARDHDDAVWVERTPTGFRAWIAIADVSSYVRPGTKIDEESLARGCSVYLPDRAIPMLPRALSSNLCSLLPDVIRLCLCAMVDVDASGVVQNTRLIRGFMKSRAKLTYGGVARALGFTENPPQDPNAEAMIDGLKIAAELSLTLRAKRMQRGALDFDLPEPKIYFDENKVPVDVKKRSQDPGLKKAYQLIEELMLLGNEVVARFLVQNSLPGVFRVHLPPDEKKLAKLQAMCGVLGVPFDLSDTTEPKRLAALVRRLMAHEQAQVLQMLLLRSMKQAAYDVQNLGHFGLASDAYLHFTSPIRRYPDLVVHRIVHRVLLGQKVDKSDEAIAVLQDAASQASTNERRAMEVEREITDLYRCLVMRPRIGESFMGTVTSIVGHGLYLSIDDPFVDVLVRYDDLGDETFEPDDDGLRVTAPRSGDTVALGDTMLITIIDVALERRNILGRRAGQPERRPGAARFGRGQMHADRREKNEGRRGGVPSRKHKGDAAPTFATATSASAERGTVRAGGGRSGAREEVRVQVSGTPAKKAGKKFGAAKSKGKGRGDKSSKGGLPSANTGNGKLTKGKKRKR